MKKFMGLFLSLTLMISACAHGAYYIPDGAVTTAKLATNSVTTVKITDANVTRAKLAAGAVPTVSVVSKTSAYTATTADDVILVSSASSWTLDLYTASGNTGRKLTIKKTSSDANTVTVDPNSTQTIDGKSQIYLGAQYEQIDIVSDGTNWILTARTIAGGGTVYFKDVKANNTAGGTSVTGTWTKRDLQTTEGDSSFSSLSSSVITLKPGVYRFYATAPMIDSAAVRTGRCKVYNSTAASDAILSKSLPLSLGSNDGGAPDYSMQGQITLTASANFEIQCKVTTGQATTGFGWNTNQGVSEVFTVVEITKIL